MKSITVIVVLHVLAVCLTSSLASPSNRLPVGQLWRPGDREKNAFYEDDIKTSRDVDRNARAAIEIVVQEHAPNKDTLIADVIRQANALQEIGKK
ncbi:hypothetical protein ElyMa_005224500 [Elysia marginata]|uniref:Uncharacterized protein n=1 Tax=Elysia marginata TaxID=1093978 RepID=A0AAV4JWC6_9GAST|nr:hypothetical protein ElyMa_005224500 [Elysia marginata]